MVKDETHRLGLPSFKALGASWAIDRLIRQHDGDVSRFVTATDGNHGRAVAHFAHARGRRSTVVVPNDVPASSVAAIEAEGADVHVVAGTYDDAVALAARIASQTGAHLVQDTAWQGYHTVPQHIVDAYETIFAELDVQLAQTSTGPTPPTGSYRGPAVVIVPTGVGSLLQAAIAHYRCGDQPVSVSVVSVEPADAACVHASLMADRPVSVKTGQTIMNGLNCGTVSSLAWPFVRAGLDAASVVSDSAVRTAMDQLRDRGLAVGPCGAAAYAAVTDELLGWLDESVPNEPGSNVPRGTIVVLATEAPQPNSTPNP